MTLSCSRRQGRAPPGAHHDRNDSHGAAQPDVPGQAVRTAVQNALQQPGERGGAHVRLRPPGLAAAGQGRGLLDRQRQQCQ